jgi:hypothetical protein
LDGFKQAILILGGKDPNNPGGDLTGVPDTATASDILDSLLNQKDGGMTFETSSATPEDDNNVSIDEVGVSVESSVQPGTGDQPSTNLRGLGITYSSFNAPGDSSTGQRVASFNIDVSNATTSNGQWQSFPVSFVLTGISFGKVITSMTLYADEGTDRVQMPLAFRNQDDGNGDTQVVLIRGTDVTIDPDSLTSAVLVVTYDPF